MGLDLLSTALATGLYLSYIPVKLFGFRDGKWTGAGFIGTVEGLFLFMLLPQKTLPYAVFLAVSILISCWLCDRAQIVLGNPDDPRIILDEIVGFWTAVAFLPKTAMTLGAGFIIFRIFDSVKIPPCRWLERLPNGWGVVGDDVGAGIMANLVIRLLMKHLPFAHL